MLTVISRLTMISSQKLAEREVKINKEAIIAISGQQAVSDRHRNAISSQIRRSPASTTDSPISAICRSTPVRSRLLAVQARSVEAVEHNVRTISQPSSTHPYSQPTRPMCHPTTSPQDQVLQENATDYATSITRCSTISITSLTSLVQKTLTRWSGSPQDQQ